MLAACLCIRVFTRIKNMTSDNIEIVKKMYALFAARDNDVIGNIFAAAIR